MGGCGRVGGCGHKNIIMSIHTHCTIHMYTHMHTCGLGVNALALYILATPFDSFIDR